MRRGGSRSCSPSEASGGTERDGSGTRDAQPSSAPGKWLGRIRKPLGNCSHHSPKSDNGSSPAASERAHYLPRHQLPAWRSHSRQAPSSPGRVAVCLLAGSGKDSRGSQQETRGHIPLGPAGQHGQHTFIPRVTDS